MNYACTGLHFPEGRGRLAFAILVSAAIHFAGMIGAEAMKSTFVVADTYRQPQLVAAILKKVEITAAPKTPKPDIEQDAPRPPELPDTSTPSISEQRQARFVVPPDFSVLESQPVPLSRHLVVRIEILASGLPGNIIVSESEMPIPESALETLQTILRLARYQPAVVDGVAVASTLEIAIDIENGNKDSLSPIPSATGKQRSPDSPDPAARQ